MKSHKIVLYNNVKISDAINLFCFVLFPSDLQRHGLGSDLLQGCVIPCCHADSDCSDGLQLH